MSSFALQVNSAAYNVAACALASQSVTNATPVNGTIIDRQAYGYAKSAAINAVGSYTVASGAGGDTVTVLLSVAHSAASDMSGSSVLATYSAVLPWVTDGALKAWAVTLPLNLLNASRYLRLTLTVTKAGAGTYTIPVAGAVCNFGGTQLTPASQYANAGYVGTTPA